MPSTQTLYPADERFLKLFLQALKRVNLDLHKKLIQIKHFDTMTWVLGWGVYSNSRVIKQIKDNLRILDGQNVLVGIQNLFVSQILQCYLYHGE